ncbi:serine/threonine protein kinase [Coemansia sp. RSA 988]|nr:serine/threonine protein kinase [Coemansia sp. RSA 988]
MARLDVSSEPTMQCALENDDLQQAPRFGLLPPTSSQKVSVCGSTMGLLTESRLSTKSTLVTVPSSNNGIAGNVMVDSIYKSLPTDSRVNAVDSTLSLNIRPAGWTHCEFGRSIQMLGAGTGGCVDLHYNQTTQKVVAIKTLYLENEQPQQLASQSPQQRKSGAVAGILGRRVLEELGIAATVRHQNIVHTHEVIVEPDHRKCYVVMDACKIDLLTLLQFQTAGKIPSISDTMLDWYFVQLVRGVKYLHSMGIGHRDLKLDNVCITEQGVLKIVDFGCATLFRRRRAQKTQPAMIATQVNRRSRGGRSRAVPYAVPRQQQQVDCEYVETMSSGTCGSDPYMAPELFLDGYYSAPKVDIWAVGIIYFAMQHRQFPWAVAQAARDSRYKMFTKDSKPFIDSWFSATAKRTMSRIFEINPASRTDIHDIIQDPWFQSLTGSASNF